MNSLLGLLGAALLGLVGIFVLRGRPPRDDQGARRPIGLARNAARTAATKARKKREAADDAADKAIDNRSHSGDPVADLEARLDDGGDDAA